MTDHTPGPWYIKEADEVWAHIASVSEGYEARCRPKSAHLIAAAPEMYAALKELWESGEWGGSARAWRKVAAAIAKAEERDE